MNKRIILEINKNDKYLIWCTNKTRAVITGADTKENAFKLLDNYIKIMDYNCNYGYYNDCNAELIGRILKTLEVY